MACYVSYLQSKEEKDQLITQIKNGHLQIIVGTHALLTERMSYNNLGLLVVDEEQVFFINRNVSLMLIEYPYLVFI
jgi:transcription-repair coupling factor (superfamily II helicase)